MNGMPPRGIWSDEKYRFGMIELQPVLGLVVGGRLGGGGSLACVSLGVFFVSVRVCVHSS